MEELDEKLPVFIYGTLRPGQKNHRRFLAGCARREVPARIRGELHVFLDPGGARYPFLVPGDDIVRGDLVELREECRRQTLADIDRLEGYDAQNDGGLYLRRRRPVETDSGETVEAWVYLWNGPWTKTVKIDSGDFAVWRREGAPES